MIRAQDEVTARKSSPENGESLSVIGSAAGALAGALGAILAGLCCVGPPTVALVGAGGAVAAAALSPYRPFLLFASFALIAFGMWQSYGGPIVAADGRICPVRAGRLARTILWTSAVVWLAAALLPFLL